jgi:hypothetical protein
MAYYKKSQTNYKKKLIQAKAQYSLNDIEEGKRLLYYLAQTKQSTNSYLKALIKADLDSKGIEYPIDDIEEDTEGSEDSTEKE